MIGAASGPTGVVVDAGPNPASRQGVIAFWTSKGAPQHVAEGIADSVKRESSFKPYAWNADDKGSPSGGLYQHHAERLAGLQGFAAVQNKPWNDAALQHEYAFREVTGKDKIAAAHWQEIVAAPDRATAQTLWDKYFERGEAIGPGGGGGKSETRRAVGRFGGMAPPKPKAEAEDDLPDAESRRDRDRMKAQLAKIAAQHATAATTPPEEKTVQAAAPAPAAETKPASAAPPPISNYQPPRFQAPSIPSVQIPQFAAPQPVAMPPAPSLGAGYRDVLAALLAPRGGGNPLANILR